MNRINGEISAPAWHLFDMAFATPATLVVAPLQDLLHLDDRARFNTPGTSAGNWNWRLSQFDNNLEGSLKGFGERAKVWGRNLESATGLLNNK
jgi:4-alpha-glucanotransferase